MKPIWQWLNRLWSGTAPEDPPEFDYAKSRILSMGTRPRTASERHVATGGTVPAPKQDLSAPLRENRIPPQCLTLNALHAFAARRELGEADLAEVGLELLPRLQDRWSEEAPAGALVFAHTGGDSVHFCLLPIDGEVVEESPVVMVVPACPDKPCKVVGDSLSEFLALGSVNGFFFLEQLVYDFEETLCWLFDREAFLRYAYADGTPPSSDTEGLEAERLLLARLSRELQLTPWPDPEARFAELQAGWGLD